MPGHSRPEDGVASLSKCRASTSYVAIKQDVDDRDKPGHDGVVCVELYFFIGGANFAGTISEVC